MNKTIAAALLLGLAALTPTLGEAAPHTACASEGDNHCVWVAADQGNREGASFYATQAGTIVPLTHEEARALIK